jgi:hypothetical protein
VITPVKAYAPPIVPTMTGNFRADTDAVRKYLVETFLPYLFTWMPALVNAFNMGPQGLGADIASATTVAFTSFAHRVTGTATIDTISVPPTIAFAGQLILLSINGFSLGTGGNIASAKSVTQNTAVFLFYSQPDQLWFPN